MILTLIRIFDEDTIKTKVRMCPISLARLLRKRVFGTPYIEMKSRGTAFLCCYYLSLLDGSPRRGEHEEYQELLQPRSLLTLTPIFLDVIGGSRLTSRLD